MYRRYPGSNVRHAERHESRSSGQRIADDRFCKPRPLAVRVAQEVIALVYGKG